MLKGIKVLSFTHFLQGPAAVQYLGDLGADVVKIENPKGAYERHWSGAESYLNGESVFYLLAGRNQRSLSINLRTEEGKEVIEKLVQEADVIIENFRPGVMERLGLGYDDVSKINPKVVYCSCSGFGSSGPYKDRPGQDLLIQAMSGLASLSGRKSDPPTLVGTALVDQHAAVLAVVGILSSLFERTRTGKGKKVESNLLNAALDLQTEPFNYYLNGTELYERSETGISSRFHQAPYGVFQTKDGYICMSLTSTETLAKVFGDDQFLNWNRDDQFSKREEINARVAENMLTQTTAYWFDMFDQYEVWYSPINSYEDVVNDPQVKWNKAITSFKHPVAGDVNVLGHPVLYNGEALDVRRVPPQLGEQTDEVLKSLGYSDEAINELIKKGVINRNVLTKKEG